MKRFFVLLLSAALLLGACKAREGIEVRDAWARASAQGMNGAVYFVILNHNATGDELIGAASDVSDAVEIHESRLEGDVMKMGRVEAVALEPSAEVTFEPGGYHVMLIGLKRDLKAGDKITVTLQFRDSPAVTLTVPVEDADGMNSDGMHSP